MRKSNKPMIEHIPDFLNYCEIEKGLSVRTKKDYNQSLKRFIEWLKKIKKANILPHDLTNDDLWAYHLYLSRYTDEKGRLLKKVTQNHYLIALRALLSYFTAKDIVSLLLDKITLQKGLKYEKTANFVNLDQVQTLLSAPNLKTKKGLRDRALLETIIATGFKITQVTDLDKDQLGALPGEIIPHIKEYLKTRQDKNNALFINYRARKEASGGRLTVRSIERTVSYYGKKIGLPFLITPEILRWVRAYTLSKEIIDIQHPRTHRIFEIKNYTLINNHSKPLCFKKSSSSWNTVENIINKEILWLKNNIPVMPEGYKENPPFLKYDEIILRKIAILITSGRITATELISKNNKDLWNNLTEDFNFKKVSHHGQGWHKKMMGVIYAYFKNQNSKITLEPSLNYGRADLGIYFKPAKNIYVEIDTVSLFKLWYNLSTMRNFTFLVIPSENKVIEFNT